MVDVSIRSCILGLFPASSHQNTHSYMIEIPDPGRYHRFLQRTTTSTLALVASRCSKKKSPSSGVYISFTLSKYCKDCFPFPKVIQLTLWFEFQADYPERDNVHSEGEEHFSETSDPHNGRRRRHFHAVSVKEILDPSWGLENAKATVCITRLFPLPLYPHYSSHCSIDLIYNRILNTNWNYFRSITPARVSDKDTAIDVETKKPRTLIIIGNIGIAGFVKGYVKGPLREIAKRLQDRTLRKEKHVDLMYVNEFCTTMLCSGCNEECYTSKRATDINCAQ